MSEETQNQSTSQQRDHRAVQSDSPEHPKSDPGASPEDHPQNPNLQETTPRDPGVQHTTDSGQPSSDRSQSDADGGQQESQHAQAEPSPQDDSTQAKSPESNLPENQPADTNSGDRKLDKLSGDFVSDLDAEGHSDSKSQKKSQDSSGDGSTGEQDRGGANGESFGGAGGSTPGGASPSGEGGSEGRRSWSGPKLIWLLVAAVVACIALLYMPAGNWSNLGYYDFRQLVEEGEVASVRVDGAEGLIYGTFENTDQPPLDPEALRRAQEQQGEQPTQEEGDGAENAPAEEAERLKPKFRVNLPPSSESIAELREFLDQHKVPYSFKAQNQFLSMLVVFFGPILLLTFIVLLVTWLMFRRTRDQMSGGLLGNFNKRPFREYTANQPRVTFDDVAGLENVKLELQEMVEFLKNPIKFQRLGARVPKGTLLMGPPGTGKTLLAKAVAGEAGVPFFSINGSEFIQLFVGVGAMRVRDLFRTAKEVAPCIVFIDEIDAVGRVRGAGFGGGHDEREQTLNQILSEMDGFSPNDSVIVMAATNRPDVLDPALLRPGRFDRHVTVDRPNLQARIHQFKVHTRSIPLAGDVNLEKLARGTVGLTGADIRNLVNEAALWATRRGKERVDMEDFEYARDKVLMGPKREEVLVGEEKEMTAYHEAGHAMLAWVLPGVDRVHKVSIIPRGRALGVTQLLPDEDRYSISGSHLVSRLTFLLGGRAAERLVYGEHSAGAEQDLKQATQLARRMVTHWGMSERLGPVAYRQSEEHPFLGKEITEQRQFSEYTARIIDEEVSRILHSADERAHRVLKEHRPELDELVKALLEDETVDEVRLEAILGKSANTFRRRYENNGEPEEESQPTSGQQTTVRQTQASQSQENHSHT